MYVLQWDEVDQKFKVTEHASVAIKVRYVLQWLHVRLPMDQILQATVPCVMLVAVCLQNARETVAPVFTKVNSAAKQQYSKALENERVR